MNIFCMGNDIPKRKCAHFHIHLYINWLNQDLQSSIFWKLSVEKSSNSTQCYYDWFFLTLVLSCKITQKNRYGYKLICLEWPSLKNDNFSPPFQDRIIDIFLYFDMLVFYLLIWLYVVSRSCTSPNGWCWGSARDKIGTNWIDCFVRMKSKKTILVKY